MNTEIDALIESYAKWLKDNTTSRIVEGWTEITTPFLDRHNDCIQIYAKRENDEYLLSDDGYIINDLEISGCQLDSPKRKAMLRTILNGFGIHHQEDTNALFVKSDKHGFPYRKHNLIQAILAINDLFCLASPIVTSLFNEDIASYFDQNDIRHTRDVKLTGKSGYDHFFNFVIPKSKEAPERIIRGFNEPNKDAVSAFVFAWLDTKDNRQDDAQGYVMLNDAHVKSLTSVKEALKNYDIKCIPWSVRQEFIHDLAA